MWCGGFCKHGPWIVRAIHFVQCLVLLIFMVDLQASYKCRGDTTYSYDCANSQPDCGFTQLLNCRYYWGSTDCEEIREPIPETNELLSCFNPEFRGTFTGTVDIRLISDSTCMRCNILHLDKETKEMDDFDLADHDMEDLSEWCFDADPTTCFKLKNVHLLALFCACPRDMGARITNEQREKYGLVAESCAAFDAERRLTDATQFVSLPKAHVDEKKLVAPAPDVHDPLPAPPRSLASGPKSKNETVNDLVSYMEWLIEKVPLENDDAFGISTMWDVDDICTVGSGNSQNTNLCQQECDWGPRGEPAFFFPKANCDQAGSWLFRHCNMYCYSACCGWLIMTLVGMIFKMTARPETWFFNPHEANELFFWQWLRVLGP